MKEEEGGVEALSQHTLSCRQPTNTVGIYDWQQEKNSADCVEITSYDCFCLPFTVQLTAVIFSDDKVM